MRAFLSRPIFSLALPAVLLVVLMAAQCSVAFGPLSGDYLVQIRNHLSSGTIMKVHCKSVEDLGAHWVGNGERFTVRFHNDNCVSIEYWCKLSWGDKNVHGGNYRFFSCDQSFLQACDLGECSWEAKDDGIYLFDIHRATNVKYYDWQS